VSLIALDTCDRCAERQEKGEKGNIKKEKKRKEYTNGNERLYTQEKERERERVRAVDLDRAESWFAYKVADSNQQDKDGSSVTQRT
jgi:hypothetical protein